MDGNDARRTDRLEAMLRAAHARRGAPPVDAGLADSVLATIKAGPVAAKPCPKESNDARIDRLEGVLRATQARRSPPPLAPDMAASVLATLKAGPGTTKQPCAAASEDARIDRLERVLRTAQARRLPPPLAPDMAASVLAAIQAEAAAEPDQETGVLWRMAAGAGLLAAATVLFALTFGSGLEGELSRLLFYDPSGQVLVSLLGV